jgi:pimeloyl-ACP methyl ester carboxylesterase
VIRTLSSVADAQAMVDALPDARLVVVPRSGHLTAVEAPRRSTPRRGSSCSP